MTMEALQFIDSLMSELSIPYAFLRAGDGIAHGGGEAGCYFTGEYIETPSSIHRETGREEATFVLRGYTDGDWLLLERAKQTIQRGIPQTAILPNGNTLSMIYQASSPIPANNAFHKSIKITFTIQEWKL